MNRMGEVLDLLGIVEGVEYDLIFENGSPSEYNPYTRIEGKLYSSAGHESMIYDIIIKGVYKLVPRPWVPTEDDCFYIIDVTTTEGVRWYIYAPPETIKTLKKRGVKFYRTQKQVEAEVERLYESGEWER